MDRAFNSETMLSGEPIDTLHFNEVSDTNTVAMHCVDPNRKISLKSTVPNSTPNTDTLTDPVAGVFLLIALTEDKIATSYENICDRTEVLVWMELTIANASENPAGSLHATDEDAFHMLETQADAPNLAEGHGSLTPMEEPNTEITTFPKRGPLYRAKDETTGLLNETKDEIEPC